MNYLKIIYLGRKGYEEIVTKMKEYGISFQTEEKITDSDDEKQALVKRILEQQKTIEEQQAEIENLSSQKKEL